MIKLVEVGDRGIELRSPARMINDVRRRGEQAKPGAATKASARTPRATSGTQTRGTPKRPHPTLVRRTAIAHRLPVAIAPSPRAASSASKVSSRARTADGVSTGPRAGAPAISARAHLPAASGNQGRRRHEPRPGAVRRRSVRHQHEPKGTGLCIRCKSMLYRSMPTKWLVYYIVRLVRCPWVRESSTYCSPLRANLSNASRISARPRDTLDFTVPTGTPSPRYFLIAQLLHVDERVSMAERNSSGNESNAAWTSGSITSANANASGSLCLWSAAMLSASSRSVNSASDALTCSRPLLRYPLRKLLKSIVSTHALELVPG